MRLTTEQKTYAFAFWLFSVVFCALVASCAIGCWKPHQQDKYLSPASSAIARAEARRQSAQRDLAVAEKGVTGPNVSHITSANEELNLQATDLSDADKGIIAANEKMNWFAEAYSKQVETIKWYAKDKYDTWIGDALKRLFFRFWIVLAIIAIGAILWARLSGPAKVASTLGNVVWSVLAFFGDIIIGTIRGFKSAWGYCVSYITELRSKNSKKKSTSTTSTKGG